MRSMVLSHNKSQASRIVELDADQVGQVAGGMMQDCPDTVCQGGKEPDITVYGNGHPTTYDC